MRTLHVSRITQAIHELCLEANYVMGDDVRQAQSPPTSRSQATSSVSVKISWANLVFLTARASRWTPVDPR
jgi:hypothetical protein